MDRIDALGPRPERRDAFARELLARSEDGELQRIVEQASADLDAPIALVTLVLDHIQFFKAHYGLPPDLAASRASRRDVSFCQFVVRDGEALEVSAAADDPGLPQHLVIEYGIAAYLGIPIRVRDTVVGSLCVLDTKPRRFTAEQRELLERLAELVDRRLAELTEQRQRARLAWTEQAAGPLLAELSSSLDPIDHGTRASLVAIPAVRAFAHLSERALQGLEVSSDAATATLEAALEAVEATESALYDIEAAAGDCRDCVSALHHLITPGPPARLSEVLMAAQDLARPSTRPVGGAPLPDVAIDPLVYTPRSLAVGFLTACLTGVATAVAREGRSAGIAMRHDDHDAGTLLLSADGLSEAAADALVTELGRQIAGDPTVSVARAGEALRISFRVDTDPV